MMFTWKMHTTHMQYVQELVRAHRNKVFKCSRLHPVRQRV